MGIARIIGGILASTSLVAAATPVLAAPPEPLIVTKMADPDPDYVPLRQSERSGRHASPGDFADNQQIDQAMESLGRAIAQAAMIEKQQVEARCRQGQPENATPEQRFAWAASCRYSRH